MRRRDFLQASAMLAAGCAPPGGPPPAPSGPPGGAITATAGYPPIGAKWKVRMTRTGLFHSSVDESEITAATLNFNGRPGYGLVGPSATIVLEPATFNRTGMLENGRIALTDSPDNGVFSWPLWVGKEWQGTSVHADSNRGEIWPSAEFNARVAAIENVTVPAGTFMAFRVEYEGGIGSSVPDNWRDPVGRPGFETREIHWYAPAPKLTVRSDIERLNSHWRGAGRTTTELLGVPK